jgi:hypothetical protein
MQKVDENSRKEMSNIEEEMSGVQAQTLDGSLD